MTNQSAKVRELNPLPIAGKPATHHPNCVCNLHEHEWYSKLRPIPKILQEQGYKPKETQK